MSWHLPSIAALRTFEAAARHLSFTRAAEEMHLTQSAVSRQIRTLEDFLGVPLFRRIQQRLVLTPAGSAYLADIRQPLEGLQAATLKMLTEQAGGVLNVATLAAFGTKWLIPRLGRFHKLHPNVLLNLVTRSGEADLYNDQFDLGVYYGDGNWKGIKSLRISKEDLVLVAAPGYRPKGRKLTSPSDVASGILLQQSKRPNIWRDWFEQAGISNANPWAGPRFEHFYMVIQAVIAGLGSALLPEILIEDELKSGRLIMPFSTRIETHEAYYLVFPDRGIGRDSADLFKGWILGELQSG
ncbi:transcriptional regulator GcvA [Xanthobacter dioxanivorans]|uniref:Transcriptional regulator GcvA n=1 Tax=Xanthobacter dioxanivorans TaxID=2528964 RepID=A0A974PSY6_9HYPH|nr:transcriptional regulator GcvA [Xanthobacter dioxanivorans]QRG09135.1 transcriptional regulator GcvA [Xanthobacter dioxanivorans]